MRILAYVLLLCLGLGRIEAAQEFMLAEQEFVKFGKKELYEQEKQSWLKEFKKNAPPICAVFDRDSSQYLYLTPMDSYGDMDDYFQRKREFKESLAMDSTLNFRVLTFHQYLPSCSYGVEKGLSTFFAKPYLHYHIYGVAPGSEASFEQRLEQMVLTYKQKKSSATWGVWKVIFGSDTPKYVVCLFAKNKESLDKQVKDLAFVDQQMHDILRRDREGNAEVKSALSLPKK